MANVFDNAGKRVVLDIPIGATNATDGMIKAAKNGAAYHQVDVDMDIDEVYLDFALSTDINTAGSGNFGVGVYADNVSLTSAQIAVAYNSANPYTSKTRAQLSKTSLDKGDLIRVDVLETFAGAATAYPMNALVRIIGSAR